MAIAGGGGWGVIEYLQLDWMDDETDGWMEKASRPQRPLLYVIFVMRLSIKDNSRVKTLGGGRGEERGGQIIITHDMFVLGIFVCS